MRGGRGEGGGLGRGQEELGGGEEVEGGQPVPVLGCSHPLSQLLVHWLSQLMVALQEGSS